MLRHFLQSVNVWSCYVKIAIKEKAKAGKVTSKRILIVRTFTYLGFLLLNASGCVVFRICDRGNAITSMHRNIWFMGSITFYATYCLVAVCMQQHSLITSFHHC